MEFLYQAIESSYRVRCLRRSETLRYIEGFVHLLMVNLRYKCSKTDALSSTELRQDLSKLKWKEEADPADFFEGLLNVQILSTKLANDHITDSNLYTIVFMATPKKYLHILQGLSK